MSRVMSDKHKAAIATSRAEAAVVRAYLDALRSSRPRRGRKRTLQSVTARLEKIDNEIGSASAIVELQLVQERRDLLAEIDTLSQVVDMNVLEARFVAVAASFSARNGIMYASWRDVGVEADLLQRAGISRSH
jgi:uncharacterized protein YicC (UPF0701 family)